MYWSVGFGVVIASLVASMSSVRALPKVLDPGGTKCWVCEWNPYELQKTCKSVIQGVDSCTDDVTCKLSTTACLEFPV